MPLLRSTWWFPISRRWKSEPFTMHGALCELVYLSMFGILKAAVHQTVQGTCILASGLVQADADQGMRNAVLDSSLTCPHHACCCVPWIPKSHAITPLHMVFPNAPLLFCPHLLSLRKKSPEASFLLPGARPCRSIIRLLNVTLSGLGVFAWFWVGEK